LTLPPSRQAGVCLHVTSLPGSYGIGEIGEHARQFIDTLSEMNIGVWQFLPTGPTAYGDSPYQPLSSFAGNELLIDIAGLIRLGLVSSTEADSLIHLPAGFVDYGDLIPKKTALLNRAADRFPVKAEATLKASFDDFLEQNDSLWLHDYALYRILKSEHGEGPWPEWERDLVHRDSDAVRRFELGAAERINNVKIIQFLFHAQWQALRRHAASAGVLLFGDMPIYVALDSADAWATPDILMIDPEGRASHVAGVPPDYFSEDGQLWGNPLYAWDNHAQDDYSWWVARMRATTEIADIVRIDHFRGFESYWAVPSENDTAREGNWEPGPGDAIFDAMRDALGFLPIVAEDLGVITDEVDALRERHRIPGMKVLQFEVSKENFDIAEVTENCVAYTGTHDNDTTIGWFQGSPGDLRSTAEIEQTRKNVLALTGGHADTIQNDLIRLALSSDARVAIAPMQDFLGLGSEARLNTPGTSCNNWRWRMQREQLTPTLCDQVREMILESGRGVPAAESAVRQSHG